MLRLPLACAAATFPPLPTGILPDLGYCSRRGRQRLVPSQKSACINVQVGAIHRQTRNALRHQYCGSGVSDRPLFFLVNIMLPLLLLRFL
jgi:hypothetical protein